MRRVRGVIGVWLLFGNSQIQPDWSMAGVGYGGGSSCSWLLSGTRGGTFVFYKSPSPRDY